MVVALDGRKNVQMVVQDHPCTLVTRPLAEAKYMDVVEYPVDRAARKMREFCKNGNATKSALAFLKAAQKTNQEKHHV